MSAQDDADDARIAVVGMAGRFPGAADVDALWEVIREGRDTILRFLPSPDDALEPDAEALASTSYVRARGVLDGVEDFDTEFFDLTPAEAAATDPQQRLWLEVAWEALESAGYAHDRHRQVTGVFAGSFTNTYLLHNLLPDRGAVEEFVRLRRARAFAMLVQNDPAFLPTRTAYKLDLHGPAINVQTACSTSLVAVTTAVKSLLSYEVDVALAGGVCIAIPQRSGYFYQEGAIQSRDGKCRPYDAAACGTVFGNGAAAVVLKRLADAKRDGDPIHAVILGAAINNDGHNKVSFAAPSVAGQAEVIVAAQALAGVSPETIGYVEGHGTGTPMGDPIEVEALTRAFRHGTPRTGFCALGSIKGNIGHLDAAAGAAGLIRAVLALEHRTLPPTAHFTAPNPELRLETTPFFVCPEARPWERGGHPRRAAVSSFGIGGTNAHVVLEEADPPPPSPRPAHQPEPTVLLVSAKGPGALDGNTSKLGAWVEAQIVGGEAPHALSDAAYVLARRRKVFPHRRAIAVRSWEDAVTATRMPERWVSGRAVTGDPKLFFVFPGQGGLRAGALTALVAADAAFRGHLAAVGQAASAKIQFDLVRWLTDEHADMAPIREDNAKAQLAIFTVDLALARWLEGRGVRAHGFSGHSLGEWVAAQMAGVVDLATAVEAVSERGRLMQSTGAGAALIVRVGEDEASRYAQGSVALACVNGPSLTLLTGPVPAIEETERRLTQDGVSFKRAPIDVAVHSPCMDAILGDFREKLARLQLSPATRPILSTVTGEWLEGAQAADREYWVQQIRRTVRFDQAAQKLFTTPCCIALEVGLGTSLTGLLAARRTDKARQRAIAALGSLEAPAAQSLAALSGVDERPRAYPKDRLERGLAELWVNGLAVDLLPAGDVAPARAPVLPTYAFNRQRCWIDAPPVHTLTIPIHTHLEAAGPVSRRSPESVLPRLTQTSAPPPAAGDSVQAILTQSIATMSRLPVAGLDKSATFADLGLDSLFLTQLADVLREKVGVPVTFADLVRNDSIERLGALLSERAGAKASRPPGHSGSPHLPATGGRMFPLRPGDERFPMLLVHGDGADHFLPPYLPEGQSVYGYLHQGADGERIELTTVESLAARCHAEWMNVCGDQPCVLAGHSYGGLVAYHVAHLRRRAGLPVSLLVMVDTHHPRDFKESGRLNPRAPRRFLQEVAVTARRHAALTRAKLHLAQGKPVPPTQRPDYVLAVYDEAARVYEPPRIDVDVLFFYAKDSHFYGRADVHWAKALGSRIEVHGVSGNHLSIIRSAECFEPIALTVSAHLKRLRTAERVTVRSLAGT